MRLLPHQQKLALGFALAMAGAPCARPASGSIKADEAVDIYPAFATLATNPLGQTVWRAPVHFRVYEPAAGALPAWSLRRVFGLSDEDLSAAEKILFRQRVNLFLNDNERGKTLRLALGDQEFDCGPTQPNGHFRGTVEWPGLSRQNETPARGGKTGWMTWRATGGMAGTNLTGRVAPLAPAGWAVISDIDDTIKVSEVRNKRALLLNTFARPYQPVPGMAGVYQQWDRQTNLAFIYLTASPWQLYQPLHGFLAENGFPDGVMEMRHFRLQDGTFLDLFKSPANYKAPAILRWLSQLPERRFILVGDSGEMDPEIYGTIGRHYPTQVQRIYIRDVSGESREAPRYQKAFDGLAPDRWRIFRDPAELLTNSPF